MGAVQALDMGGPLLACDEAGEPDGDALLFFPSPKPTSRLGRLPQSGSL